ncbi:ATP-dependent helicase [Diaphorobacter sp. HDW4A]|uniref:3'-5' exonuclease n=1 Tax=Diaphorobacter sp. HDW4A TaxID=2714924 RepID=UPI00140BCD27|nr:ATP-dependent helicase [Diaphorobacter sp. HDW4A]QIL82531.1 ATP-dependent helicase [Diaphorobacter sp. HDW4A]
MSQPASTPARFAPKVITPSDEQRAIQVASERTIIVEANAGAAKTTTLALRVAESLARGVPTHRIIALTHTQPACVALQRTLLQIGVARNDVGQLRIQTFEDFSKDILKGIDDHRVDYVDENEQLRTYFWDAVQRVEEDESERWRDELSMPAIGDSWFVEEFLKINTRLKGTMRDVLERDGTRVSPEYAESIGIDYTQLRVYLAYERIRRQENADTPKFRGEADATYDLARHFVDGENVQGLRNWPFTAQIVLIDEMHDLNFAMFRVLVEILNTSKSFFCGMGDVDQVVHEATGADAVFMKNAIEEHTSRAIKRYPLTHSYRFGKSLAAKAGRVANKPYSSNAAHDTRITLQTFTSNEECASLVIDAAKEWKRTRRNMSEFAILLRHPVQSVLMENLLIDNELPYAMSGFESYLKRPEVLFIRGLMAVATDDMQSLTHEDTREQVLTALHFFSGTRIEVANRPEDSQATLLADAISAVRDNPMFLTSFFNNQVLRTAEPHLQKRLQAAQQLAATQSGPTFLQDFLKALDIQSIINEAYVSKDRRAEALSNIEGLQLAASRFNSAFDYFSFLNTLEQKQRDFKDSKRLQIASIVSVKGLEFEHVLVPHLTQGEFPAANGTSTEERNLFYVAITRAKQQLTLLGHGERGSGFLGRVGGEKKESTASVE